jgi:Ulp1 protease family, C-terminal catalytic domain
VKIFSSWVDRNLMSRVKKLFIPVNVVRTHWYLCAITPGTRRVEVYDSLLSGKDITHTYYSTLISCICHMLSAECFLWGEEFNEDDWTFQIQKCLQQDNGNDCGVFTIRAIDRLLDDLNLNNHEDYNNSEETPLNLYVKNLRLNYGRIILNKQMLPYRIINHIPTVLNDDQTKLLKAVVPDKIFQVKDRDIELEALIVDLFNSKQINYVFFENMPSVEIAYNVDMMLQQHGYYAMHYGLFLNIINNNFFVGIRGNIELYYLA